MNAMLPGQDPLQQHMKWAEGQQRDFVDRRHKQAAYDDWKRRRRGKRSLGTPGPQPPGWTSLSRARPSRVPTGSPVPGPRVAERHHPVRAVFTVVAMLVLTAVAVVVADLMMNGLWALILAGGLGLVVTVIVTRRAWRDR